MGTKKWLITTKVRQVYTNIKSQTMSSVNGKITSIDKILNNV